MSWELAQLTTLRDRLTQGITAEQASRELKQPRREVEAVAHLLELPFGEPTELMWCDYCGNEVVKLDKHTGWCIPCTTKMRVEEQRMRDDEERERLETEARREADRTKQQRHRMREEFDATPRSGRGPTSVNP